MKSPALAACLSFLYAGLGQLYCGAVGRGLAIMLAPIVFVLSLFVGPAHVGLLLTLYVLLVVFYVWQIVDAYQCAERANRSLTRSPRSRRGRARSRGRRRSRRVETR